jgi:hypothetical protein
LIFFFYPDPKGSEESRTKFELDEVKINLRNGPMCSLDTFYLEKGFYPALNSDLQNNKIFRILAKGSSR